MEKTKIKYDNKERSNKVEDKHTNESEQEEREASREKGAWESDLVDEAESKKMEEKQQRERGES
jgi:hypothetical protein